MTSKRVVRVDRDGYFEVAGHRYWLGKSQFILNEGMWECWDEEPDTGIPAQHLASPGPGPGRPLWVEPTYREARDRIDRAAERGHF